jgi:hypothetical protein
MAPKRALNATELPGRRDLSMDLDVKFRGPDRISSLHSV